VTLRRAISNALSNKESCLNLITFSGLVASILAGGTALAATLFLH
jgi:hypothetical protein